MSFGENILDDIFFGNLSYNKAAMTELFHCMQTPPLLQARNCEETHGDAFISVPVLEH